MDAVVSQGVRQARVRSSRVVLSPRCWRQVGGECDFRPQRARHAEIRSRRGLASPVPRGEHGVSRKAIAQGVPDCLGEPVVTTCLWAFYPFPAREGCCEAASGARHSLRPLRLRRTTNCKTRAGIPAARMRSHAVAKVVYARRQCEPRRRGRGGAAGKFSPTVIVIFFETTGGLNRKCLPSPNTSWSVCLPGSRSRTASVCPAVKC